MAYCAKCGTQINEGSAFCQNCGAAAPGAAAPPPTATASSPTAPTAVAVKTNPLAVVSLVAGIVSLLFNPFTIISICAIVFGFIALNQLKKAPDLKGKGMAVAGIILGAIFFVITLIVIIVAGTALSMFF